jgi:Na+/proline symporter
MSMLSGDYNACAGVLTNDVYRRLIHKKASQRELVLIGRLMTLVIGAFALLVAMIFGGTPGENIFRYMVTLFSIFTPPVAVAMILGLLSKRVTNASAMVGFVCGLTVSLGLFICFYGVFGFGPFFPDKVDTAILTGLVWSPAKDEMVFGAWRLKMEVILFACNTLVTLIATLVVALLKPMGAEEQEQVETFRQRLATPIGQLEEDRPAATVGRAIPSPFGVCGVCTLLIGALMLGVAYWVWKTGNPLAVGLDVGFGAALVLIGWLMARYSAPVKPQEADAAN